MDEKYFPVLSLDGDAMLTLHLVLVEGTVDTEFLRSVETGLYCFTVRLGSLLTCFKTKLPITVFTVLVMDAIKIA